MSQRAFAPDATPHRWMTLGAASRFLGVDDSTLRAWADAGRIGAFRTPGGHRRFARDELDAFLRRSRPALQAHPSKLIPHQGTRLLVGSSGRRVRREGWYAAIDAPTSAAMREICQQLMRALAGYLTGGRHRRTHLEDGARAGTALGVQVATVQLTPAAATRAFVFFRALLTDAVATNASVPPDQRVRSIGQMDTFLNHVLTRMMEAYERQRANLASSSAGTSRGSPAGAPRASGRGRNTDH